MPVLDGFEATRQIREFEDETWEEFVSSSQHTGITPTEPAPRAVIIAVATALSLPGLEQRIANAGFDLGICNVMGDQVLPHLLLTGPGSNVAGVYGAVEDQALRDAGYSKWPLRAGQIRGNETFKASEVGELWRVWSDD
jgi:CheY-like chemotaxis protein